jgi:SOS-response transcriptional repressor LexA
MEAAGMMGLTPQQGRCLDAIRRHAEAEHSPSVRELMVEMGVRSSGRVQEVLCALRERGYIEWTPSKARSIRLTGVDLNPLALDKLASEELRLGLAAITGILAHREGGYAPETCKTLRNIADRLECKPKGRAA